MTGDLVHLDELKGKLPSYTCAIFYFTNGEAMAYTDRRRLGRIGFAKDLEDLVKIHDLGPDALHVKPEEFESILKNKKGKVKPTLMDQSLIAGLGNVYTDEVLFQAKIHPESSLKNFEAKHFIALHKNISPVVVQALKVNGERSEFPKSKFLMSHRVDGGNCPRDNNTLTVKTVGGRTTYFCEKCQELL